MFDIGFSELLIIAVVALLVLGPERLPKAARFAGLWVRRARAQWYSVKAEFEREIAQEELVKQIREPFGDAIAETGAQMRALDAQLQAPLAAIAATASTLDADPAPAAGAELELTPAIVPPAMAPAAIAPAAIAPAAIAPAAIAPAAIAPAAIAPAAIAPAAIAPAAAPQAALDVSADGSAALLPDGAEPSSDAPMPADSPQVDWLAPTQGELLGASDSVGDSDSDSDGAGADAARRR